MALLGISRRHSSFQRFLLPAVLALLLCCPAALGTPASSKPSRQSLRSTAEALAAYVGVQHGWSRNLTKLKSINFEDAKVRHVLSFEVGLRVKGKQKEFSLQEEITPWDFLIPALPPPPGEPDHAATSDASSAAAEAGHVVASQGQGRRWVEEEQGSKGRPRVEEDGESKGKPWVEEQGLALLSASTKRQELLSSAPSLPPFILEGPVQLWIEGVSHLRLAMPHDVDAGDVKKVVLAAGAAVSIAGCQEVSLARPLQLPLPLETEAFQGVPGPLSLHDLAAKLRRAAFLSAESGRTPQLLALRIIRPLSITAAVPSTLALPEGEGSAGGRRRQARQLAEKEPSSAVVPVAPRMRVKRLSEKSVELQLRDDAGSLPLVGMKGHAALLAGEVPGRISLWPFAFDNASHAKLSGFQEALLGALGDAASKKGTFQLVKARASVRKLFSVPFQVELQTKARVNLSSMLLGPTASTDATAEAETVPLVRQQWEVLLQEGQEGKLQAVRLKKLDSVQPSVTLSPSLVAGNSSIPSEEVALRMPGLAL